MLVGSRVDYFLLVKDRTATIKLENAQANINASKTVTASPPFIGDKLTTLEKRFYCLLIIAYNSERTLDSGFFSTSVFIHY